MERYLSYHPLVPGVVDTPARLIAVILVFGWAPVAGLAAAEGTLLPGSELGWQNAFLLDPLVLATLVALPILVFVNRSLEANLDQTLKALDLAGILPPERGPFERARALVNRVQSSRGVMVGLFAGAVIAGAFMLWSHLSDPTPTWWGANGLPSLAGAWFTLVLNTFLLYVFYTWGLRGVLWAGLIVAVSRCELVLNPTHPDRCCGLMTFSRSSTRWALLLAVAGMVLAAHIFGTVFLRGLPLVRTDIVIQVATYMTTGAVTAIVPLFSFTPQLLRARRRAELSLSYFASAYARELRAKIRTGADDPLALDGSISGLADMYALYENVTTLRWAPLDLRAALRVLAVLLSPFVPLFLPALQDQARAWLELLTRVSP